jgi:hypothetical protein
MAGPYLETVTGIISRPEKWEAVDVVDMRMCQKDMRAQPLLTRQTGAQRAKTCARIKNQTLVTTSHFDASRVAAVNNGFGTRAGHSAPHAPKAHREISSISHRLFYAVPSTDFGQCINLKITHKNLTECDDRHAKPQR